MEGEVQGPCLLGCLSLPRAPQGFPGTPGLALIGLRVHTGQRQVPSPGSGTDLGPCRPLIAAAPSMGDTCISQHSFPIKRKRVKSRLLGFTNATAKEQISETCRRPGLSPALTCLTPAAMCMGLGRRCTLGISPADGFH